MSLHSKWPPTTHVSVLRLAFRLANVALAVVFKSAEYVPAQGREELVNKIGADISLCVNLVFVTIVTIQKRGQFLTKIRHGGI